MNGFCLFDDNATLEGQAQVVNNSSSQSSEGVIMLWHCSGDQPKVFAHFLGETLWLVVRSK